VPAPTHIVLAGVAAPELVEAAEFFNIVNWHRLSFAEDQSHNAASSQRSSFYFGRQWLPAKALLQVVGHRDGGTLLSAVAAARKSVPRARSAPKASMVMPEREWQQRATETISAKVLPISM
jgi:hypothetical protein